MSVEGWRVAGDRRRAPSSRISVGILAGASKCASRIRSHPCLRMRSIRAFSATGSPKPADPGGRLRKRLPGSWDSRPTYIAIEKGERTAKADEIIKLASFFGDRGDRRSTGDPSRTESWGVGRLLPRTGEGVGRRGSSRFVDHPSGSNQHPDARPIPAEQDDAGFGVVAPPTRVTRILMRPTFDSFTKG